MKKLILSLAFVTGLSTMAFAQEKKDSCCVSDKAISKVEKVRHGKDADRKDIKKKHKKHDSKRIGKQNHRGDDAMFKNLNLTDAQKTKIKELRKEHRDKMVELKKSQFEEMKSVLTPDQITKLETSKKDRVKKGRMEGTVRHDAATEAKIKELNAELKGKREAIKKTKLAPDAMKQKLKDLNEEYAKKRAEVVEQSIKK